MVLFRLVLSIFFALSPACWASRTDFVLNPGRKWQLTDGARAKFNLFLENERLHLLERLPGLDFPGRFESVDGGIRRYMSADSTDFRNRSVSCSFLDKMRKGLSANDSRELDRLTRKSRVCVQSDLAASEQLGWTQKMARFIWTSTWIEWKGRRLSLEAYLVDVSGDLESLTPRILAMKTGSFDGWGISQSQKDRSFFAGSAVLKRVFALAAGFDPNDPGSFGILGPAFKKFIERDPFNAANLLVGRPTIYLSNGWPPNAMVELLAHEYGHIFRRLRSAHYSGSAKRLAWINDEVHEEASAEAFAWMTLRPLYQDYPEVEVFHVSKLIFMNEFTPGNFHYVGAAGLQDSFHRPSDGDFDELKKFDSSTDLGAYLKKAKNLSLVNEGPMPESVVEAAF